MKETDGRKNRDNSVMDDWVGSHNHFVFLLGRERVKYGEGKGEEGGVPFVLKGDQQEKFEWIQ